MNTTTEKITRDAVEQYLWDIKDTEEIKNMWNILKRRKRQLDEVKTQKFNIGDEVSWMHKGRRRNGTITKINRKTVTIDEHDSYNKWRIAPSYLMEE